MEIFPDDLEPDETGLVALGGHLDSAILIEAYSKGIFPWTGAHPIPWYSPDPRMLLEPGKVYVSRSLEKLIRRGVFEVREDTRYATVMHRCAQMPRAGQPGTWITANMHRAYTELHKLGVTHSVETYQDGALVGGLYGVAIGRAFFGESMFSEVSNASKVALVHLCRRLAARGYAFIDFQQETPHLRSMGARPVPRAEFLARLAEAVRHPNAWDLDPD